MRSKINLPGIGLFKSFKMILFHLYSKNSNCKHQQKNKINTTKLHTTQVL